jgi:hypothetical protein
VRSPPLRAVARDRWFVALFAVGFVIRFLLLQQKGTLDMDQYLAWGNDVVSQDLAFSYHGIYFPVQYLVFALAVKLSWWLDISGITAIKAINFSADIASFGLLVVLLRRWGLSHRWALVYWLTPYFLAIYWLGYIDAQIGFLILLTLVILSYRQTFAAYLIAGIPFGIAFLMKPQVLTLMGMLGLAWLLAVVAPRRLRLADWTGSLRLGLPAMVAFAAVLFVAFSLYVGANGEVHDKGYGYVAHTYTPSELERQSAGFTGNMLNVWFPVAFAYREGDEPVYAVAEPAVLNKVGAVVALLFLAAGALLVMSRTRSLDLSRTILCLFLVGAAVVPMIATHAHENHLFLASVLTVPLLAMLRDRWLVIAYQAILAVQFVNLIGRYGFGSNSLSGDLLSWLTWYSDGESLIGAIAMLFLFAFFATRLVLALSTGRLAVAR